MTLINDAIEEVKIEEEERLKGFLAELCDPTIELDIDDIKDSDTLTKEQKEWILSKHRQSKSNSYTWGLDAIDERITTPKRGQVVLLVADENQGKSTFCYFFARENKRKYGHEVYYINLEQTKDEMIDAKARQFAGVTKLQHRDGEYLKNSKYLQKIKELRGESDINFIGRKANELTNIESVIEQVNRLENIDFLLLDNLSCLSMRATNENEQMKETLLKVMDLSQQKNIPIVLVHHYKKDSNDRKRLFKSTGEIKGSGYLKDLAPLIIQVTRNPDDEDPKVQDEFHIREGKLRNGDKRERVMVRHSKGDFVPDPLFGSSTN